jgi:hypothetical protein
MRLRILFEKTLHEEIDAFRKRPIVEQIAYVSIIAVQLFFLA